MLSVLKNNEKPYTLSIQDVAMPKIKKGHVLLKVKGAGICGSDLHMYAGHSGYDWVSYPLILGHEITGVVVEADKDELIGKRVVVNPYIPCNNCEYCLRGEMNLCDSNSFYSHKLAPRSLSYGFRENGGMAEYCLVREENIVSIPDEISDEVAAILESVAVGLTAVEKVGTLTNKTIAIFGPGPIGLGITSLLVGLNAKRIVVVGAKGDEDRLRRAELIGAHQTIITSNKIVENLLEIHNGYDVVFDCSGHHSVPETAIPIVKKGGQIILVGISTNAFTVRMDQIVRGEIQLKGSYGITQKTLLRTIEHASDNNFPFEKLIGETFHIQDAKEAFDVALNHSTGKIILKMES